MKHYAATEDSEQWPRFIAIVSAVGASLRKGQVQARSAMRYEHRQAKGEAYATGKDQGTVMYRVAITGLSYYSAIHSSKNCFKYLVYHR
ncbi:unnamed protein product [Leptidea sinapis]|uniref:Uncharacterized protein n=1 Tax=Leptidea sinapis TaxID=189913 RepID=A0A5E4R0A2_9NEOP|nr:unnamed protein product [Leptidea sinapis]